MSKLLAANFTRLKKDKVFWICIIFMIFMGLYVPIMNYVEATNLGLVPALDTGFFIYVLLMTILLAVFCSLFLGTEYSDGTIRNKVVIGHGRGIIYLSNLIVCIAAGFLICLAYLIPTLGVGIPLVGFFKSDIRVILGCIGCIFVLTTAFASFYTLIAMLNQNKAIVATICILSVFLNFFSGIYIRSRLSEVEIYESYVFTNNEGRVITEDARPNPDYLKGTEREVYEFLYDFLPGGQVVQLSEMEFLHLWQKSLYSGILIIITTGFGVFFFRKKDLK